MNLITCVEEARSDHAAPGTGADNGDAPTQEDLSVPLFADSA
jgi:hypothetical protein